MEFSVHEGEEEELQKVRILPVRAPAVHCRARVGWVLKLCRPRPSRRAYKIEVLSITVEVV